jgi:hypothetical protein
VRGVEWHRTLAQGSGVLRLALLTRGVHGALEVALYMD